jgi:hypothetical protein
MQLVFLIPSFAANSGFSCSILFVFANDKYFS